MSVWFVNDFDQLHRGCSMIKTILNYLPFLEHRSYLLQVPTHLLPFITQVLSDLCPGSGWSRSFHVREPALKMSCYFLSSPWLNKPQVKRLHRSWVTPDAGAMLLVAATLESCRERAPAW